MAGRRPWNMCLPPNWNLLKESPVTPQQEARQPVPLALCGSDLFASIFQQQPTQVHEIRVLGIEGFAHTPLIGPLRPEHRRVAIAHVGIDLIAGHNLLYQCLTSQGSESATPLQASWAGQVACARSAVSGGCLGRC